MGGALIFESIVLLNWCERHGLGPLGLTGISMGGHMASLAACNWNKPVVLVPCLTGSTASCVFTEGVLSRSIPWDILQSQYYGDAVYTEEIKHLITSQSKQKHVDAYTLGQNLVKSFPGSVESVQTLQCNSSGEERYIVRQTDSNVTDINSTAKNNSLNQITNLPQDKRQSKLDKLDKEMSLKKNGSLFFEENIQKNALVNAVSSLFKQNIDQDVLDFMIGVMDEFTYLGNFSIPVDTSLIIIVHAKQDAYIPRGGVPSLEDLWPGSEVRFIDTGHVIGCAAQQSVFRQAIIDAFDKQIKKYYS